jgi:hypothetical protein
MRFMILAAALTLGLSASASAQQSVAQNTGRTIGTPQQQHMVPSLIVLNARGASLKDQKLVLEGVAPNAIVFADRPVRAAGHALTAHLLDEWKLDSSDSFAKNPPNATVSALNKAGGKLVDAVLVLKSPTLQGDRLTFDVQVLEGDLAGADGPATVFIDIVNLPATRGTGARAAWYYSAR